MFNLIFTADYKYIFPIYYLCDLHAMTFNYSIVINNESRAYRYITNSIPTMLQLVHAKSKVVNEISCRKRVPS